jgi:hypothetical protein
LKLADLNESAIYSIIFGGQAGGPQAESGATMSMLAATTTVKTSAEDLRNLIFLNVLISLFAASTIPCLQAGLLGLQALPALGLS